MPIPWHIQLIGKSSTAAEPHEKLENKSPAIRRRENNFQTAIREPHRQASKFHNCKEPGNIYNNNNNNNINGRKLLQNPANEGPYIYRKEIAERSETPRKAKEAKNNNDLLTWLIIIWQNKLKQTKKIHETEKKKKLQCKIRWCLPIQKRFSHALEANVVPESRPGAELWPSERSEAAEDDDEEGGGGENGQGKLAAPVPILGTSVPTMRMSIPIMGTSSFLGKLWFWCLRQVAF